MKDWNPNREQLLCRDVQHAWTPTTARTIRNRGITQGFIRSFVCSRCGTTKSQRLDLDGYLLGSNMKYTDGYVRPGEGRFTRYERAELRLQNMGDNHEEDSDG